MFGLQFCIRLMKINERFRGVKEARTYASPDIINFLLTLSQLVFPIYFTYWIRVIRVVRRSEGVRTATMYWPDAMPASSSGRL